MRPARDGWPTFRSVWRPALLLPTADRITNTALSSQRKHKLSREGIRMSDTTNKPRTRTNLKVERPRLHKVILVNDDYTPREFVVTVLKAEFRMTEDEAYKVMITAHRKGSCVVAVYAQDVAETKAARATEAGRLKGYPLLFTTEPEE